MIKREGPYALFVKRRASQLVAHLRYNRGDRSFYRWKPARALPFANGPPPYGNHLVTDLVTERERLLPAT